MQRMCIVTSSWKTAEHRERVFAEDVNGTRRVPSNFPPTRNGTRRNVNVESPNAGIAVEPPPNNVATISRNESPAKRLRFGFQ